MDALDVAKDVSVKAPQSSIVLDFPVSRLAKMNAASASISVTPGSQLHEDSLFYFFYNDKLLETRTAKELRQKKEVTFNLPLGTESRDSILLQIKSKMFISKDLCRDYATGGLFFTLHKESRVNLNYEMAPVRNEADFFGSLQQGVYVVVPNTATLPETMPATWTYGILKKNFPHLDVQIVRARDLANKPPMPRIWVGLRNQLPAYFNKTQPGISLVDPNTLLISAPSLPEMESLAKKLANLPFFSTNPSPGQKMVINAANTSDGKSKEGISFGNQAVQEGILQVSSSFLLFPSLLATIPEEVGIHLDGSHMVSFDQGRPVRLDVFFNNNLVHSSMLDQSGRFSRDIVLPPKVELLAKNNLNVQFNYSEDPGQCSINGKAQSAQVFPTSYLWGSGQKKPERFAWSNIGLFFGRQGTVLIDEKLSEDPLNMLAGIVLLLNRQLPPSTYAFPSVQALGDQVFIPTEQYVVALAAAGNVPSYLQDLMPSAQGKNAIGYAMPVEHQPNINSVVGKIAENKGFPVILLTTNMNGAMLAGALQYFSQPLNYEGLTGNIMVYRQPGQIHSLEMRDGEKRTVTNAPNAIQGRFVRFWELYKKELIIIGLIIIGLFLFVLIFQYFKRRRIRRQRELLVYEENYEDEDEEYDDEEEQEVLVVEAPKRRGRPAKESPVLVKPAAVVIKPTAKRGETAPEPMPKRRGKPVKTESAAAIRPPAVAAQSTPKRVATVPEPLPKRRGRPAKSAQPAEFPTAAAAIKPTAKRGEKAPEPMPKRRGRPRKEESAARNADIEMVSKEKKPGRPKKNVTVVAESTGKTAQIVVEPKSTRSSKSKNNKAAAKPKEQTNKAVVKTTRKQNGTQRKKPAASTELIKKMPELKVIPAPKLRNRK